MQYDNDGTNTEDCQSHSTSDSVAELMRNDDARRRLLAAATRALRATNAGMTNEDLVSETVCSLLAGEFVCDERSLIEQLIAEIGKRGRLLRRQCARSAQVVSDDELLFELVDESTEPSEELSRDAVEVLNVVQIRAADDPAVLRLIAVQLAHGRARPRDAYAAGFTRHQYPRVKARLVGHCRAVVAALREAAARSEG